MTDFTTPAPAATPTDTLLLAAASIGRREVEQERRDVIEAAVLIGVVYQSDYHRLKVRPAIENPAQRVRVQHPPEPITTQQYPVVALNDIAAEVDLHRVTPCV